MSLTRLVCTSKSRWFNECCIRATPSEYRREGLRLELEDGSVLELIDPDCGDLLDVLCERDQVRHMVIDHGLRALADDLERTFDKPEVEYLTSLLRRLSELSDQPDHPDLGEYVEISKSLDMHE